MIKAIAIFGALSFVFYLFKVYLLCYICGGLAALIGIILWILLVVEHHQDEILNEQALKEWSRNEKD